MQYFKESTKMIQAKYGEEAIISFEKTPECPAIAGLASSCGCSTPVDRKGEGFVEVRFTPQGLGFYNKVINVSYVNGEQESLAFSAEVKA